MQYTKKMIMLPEDENMALMKLFTGGDVIKAEKASTESNIQKLLDNPKISALEKNKNYNLLVKKRRQLKKIIENKERPRYEERPLPTEGISPAKEPILRKIQDKVIEPSREPHREPVKRITRYESLDKYQGMYDPDMYDEIKNRIEQYSDHYGLTSKGQIMSVKKKSYSTIKGSDYLKVLDFLTGKSSLDENQKNAVKTLIPRLLDDDFTRQNIIPEKKKQIGAGRKYIIDLKKTINISKKTPGLKRQKFKPQLWVKLNV